MISEVALISFTFRLYLLHVQRDLLFLSREHFNTFDKFVVFYALAAGSKQRLYLNNATIKHNIGTRKPRFRRHRLK